MIHIYSMFLKQPSGTIRVRRVTDPEELKYWEQDWEQERNRIEISRAKGPMSTGVFANFAYLTNEYMEEDRKRCEKTRAPSKSANINPTNEKHLTHFTNVFGQGPQPKWITPEYF